ncbi:MAG TPA: LysR family transcriptional regulator [Beijerinckiaceae bacterium]|nr:LysR family transcriptional regulator [Beijerinckiaceae bacterium]
MEKVDAMRAFVKVVACGSYSEAARRLGVTRSALSKAVSELEEGLGARLLDRTTRRLSPTEAGSTYFDRCSTILAQIEEAENEISRLNDQPRGLLRVNGPMSFGTLYLGAAVADFMALYRDVRVELSLTDQFIDPLVEGVDLTIRIGRLDDSSLIARRIAPARRVLVASPEYLRAYGVPRSPEDLADHVCLEYGPRTAAPRWQLTREGELISVPIVCRLSSNNGETLREAALRGLGVAQLPTFLVGPDLCAGRLTVVLPEHAPPDLGIHALYASNRFMTAKSRAFIDFLVARFGSRPEWDRIPE